MDLRIEKTEIALKDALLKLLPEKGFEKLTVNELCEEAKIRRTTFYHHYSDKYDFVNKSIERWFKELIEVKYEGEDYDFDSYFLFLLERNLQYLAKNKKDVDILYKSDSYFLLDEMLQNTISRLLCIKMEELGRYKAKMEREISITAYVGVYSAITRYFVKQSHVSLPEIENALEAILEEYRKRKQ